MKFEAGKITVLAVLTGLVVFGGLVYSSVKNTSATFTYPVTICHHNPGNEVTLTFNNQQSYFGHLGQPHNAQTYDTFGACTTPTPTPSDSCDQTFEYTKSSDFDDDRVNINFFNYNPPGPNNDEDRVTVTAKSGYSLVSIWYDWHGDGEGDLDDQWPVDENPETVDAAGVADVTDVKVTVKKVCETPKTPVCGDRSYDNYGGDDGEFDEETEVADNGLCENEQSESTPTPAPTPDSDVCDNIDGVQGGVPDGMHLDASGLNCVNWSQSGPPVRNDEGTGQVQGASTTGQVLGASTMAGAGGFAEAAYQVIMGVGGILTYLGIKKNKKASN